MKMISWNVGGIGARIDDGTLDKIFELDPDIFCIQEVQKNPKNLEPDIIHKSSYYSYFYSPSRTDYQKVGKSGVATYTKYAPISLKHGFGNKFDKDGRIQTIEFEEFNLFNVYFPTGGNARKSDDTREKYEFYELFTKYVNESDKPQIICGDFNRGASKLDIYSYSSSTNGFRMEELAWFEKFLESGFIDSFRYINKNSREYTWWSNRGTLREENKGSRLDYFLVSEKLKDNIVNASILHEIPTKDHAPISLELEF